MDVQRSPVGCSCESTSTFARSCREGWNMKFNKYLAGVFIALVGIGFVVTFKGQNSTQSKPSQLSTKVLNGREAKALDDAATPTADFDIDNTADLSYER